MDEGKASHVFQVITVEEKWAISSSECPITNQSRKKPRKKLLKERRGNSVVAADAAVASTSMDRRLL